jgi:hypothetical protein
MNMGPPGSFVPVVGLSGLLEGSGSGLMPPWQPIIYHNAVRFKPDHIEAARAAKKRLAERHCEAVNLR